MVGVVLELGLKLLGCLWILFLSPQEIAQSEVHIRLLWIGLDRCAKHFYGACIVFHLVQRFAGQHVGFGRIWIEGQHLVIDIEHIVVLLGPEIAVGKDKQQLNILRVVGYGFFEVGRRFGILRQSIVRHADQRS